MRRSFLFVIAFVVAACGGKVFVDNPSGSTTTANVGGQPGVGGFNDGASAPGTGGFGGGPTCFSCACSSPLSQGGCADICTMGLNGTTNPNFCDGAAALSQCAACIAQQCGESDPADCAP
jgi:hypothetical protein